METATTKMKFCQFLRISHINLNLANSVLACSHILLGKQSERELVI